MVKNVRSELGERFKKVRISMDMNKKEFATLIGIPDQNLGRIEKGTLGLSVDRFLSILNKLDKRHQYYLVFGEKL